MTDELITVDDLRRLRNLKGEAFCIPGVRAWGATHGLDFNAFVREGISAEKLLATGDQLALDVVRFVRQEHGNGQG